MKILCFGASSTYGAGDPLGGWTARLRANLDAEVPANQVNKTLLYNLGISSQTTQDLRERFEQEAKPRCKSKADTTIILHIGGNDASFIPSKDAFRVPVDQFAQNMDWLIALAKTYADKVLVLTLTPVIDSVTIDQGAHDRSKSNAHNEQYNAKLLDICTEHQVTLINTWSAFMEADHQRLICDDGIHPNGDGHQLIFELVKPHL